MKRFLYLVPVLFLILGLMWMVRQSPASKTWDLMQRASAQIEFNQKEKALDNITRIKFLKEMMSADSATQNQEVLVKLQTIMSLSESAIKLMSEVKKDVLASKSATIKVSDFNKKVVNRTGKKDIKEFVNNLTDQIKAIDKELEMVPQIVFDTLPESFVGFESVREIGFDAREIDGQTKEAVYNTLCILENDLHFAIGLCISILEKKAIKK